MNNCGNLVEEKDFSEILNIAFSSADGPSSVSLTVTGSSMVPFLAEKRDTVYLTQFNGKAKKGDILFYRRDNGKCILHRVKKVTETGIDFIGDSQTYIESNVKPENILAICKSAKRKGKLINEKSIVWLFFKHIWLNIIPLRIAIINLIAKIKHKK